MARWDGDHPHCYYSRARAAGRSWAALLLNRYIRSVGYHCISDLFLCTTSRPHRPGVVVTIDIAVYHHQTISLITITISLPVSMTMTVVILLPTHHHCRIANDIAPRKFDLVLEYRLNICQLCMPLLLELFQFLLSCLHFLFSKC